MEVEVETTAGVNVVIAGKGEDDEVGGRGMGEIVGYGANPDVVDVEDA